MHGSRRSAPPSSEGDRDALLEMLGRAGPPEIWLPKTSFHEVRYYQPVVRMGGSDRVLHHDFYAVPEGGCFWFQFNVSLTVGQRALLEALLGHLRYLGRSESRARLRVVDCAEPPAGLERVAPRSPGPLVTNIVYRRVLCAAPDFRASDLWAVRDGGGKTSQRAGHPPHLVDVLLDKKMPLPSGARWVEYAVPGAILVHEIRPHAQPPAPKPDVEVAELYFRLNRRVPIPLQSLVAVARAFRDAAVARHRGHSRTLTGREADGSVARGHEHAYYLPRLSEARLAVEGLVVRIPTGRLAGAELDALLGVDHIRIDGSPYPITVVPEQTVTKSGDSVTATRWRSVTPFLPPLRHRARRERTIMEEQIAVCAERLCGVRPVLVQRSYGPGGLGEVSPLLAHQYFGGERRGLKRRLGFWLELTFDEPVALAAPLGADAHFGAGQFEPVET